MFLRSYWTFVNSVQQWIRFSLIPATAEHATEKDALQFDDCDELNIIIPGNPGIDLFYDLFAQFLHEKRREQQKKSQTLIISHSNHVRNTAQSGTPFTDLGDQITHKLQFLISSCKLPEGVKINLIGHSIGAYMCLKMAPELSQRGFNLGTTVCLFPTIERMRDSPEGRKFTILRRLGLHHLIIHVLMPVIYYCIPDCVKRWLIRLACVKVV